MFETKEFRDRLTNMIISAAGENNLEEYEPRILDFLQKLASENEGTLMPIELRKAQGERRGQTDALANARRLAVEASRYAVADKRKTLQFSDIDRAYKAKYCQFWPFYK
jgi:hypothetical protein